jgi:hypothetical protein
MLPPKPANDGVGELAAIGREIYLEGIPEFNIVLALPATVQTPRAFATFHASEDFPTLT